VSLAFFLFFAFPAAALDYEFIGKHENGWPKKTRISGSIQKGDYERLIAFIRKQPTSAFIGLAFVELDSTGGNVAEAMRIASLIKLLYPSIGVVGQCASSCLLLWLSGASRLATSTNRVGIHRPTLPQEELTSIPLAKLEDNFKKFNETFKEFVLQQGLPMSLYERLLSTESGDIYWLSAADLKLIGTSPPYFAEKEKAICGKQFKQYVASRSENDMLAYNECYYAIARRERIAAIDSILGKHFDPQWAVAKQKLMKGNL